MVSITLTTLPTTFTLLLCLKAHVTLAVHQNEEDAKLEPDDFHTKYLLGRGNIAKIREFYKDIFEEKDVDGAADKLISPENYIEHNPHQEDGLQGFKRTMRMLTDASPGQTMDIRRILADGEFVIVHGRTSWLGNDVAFVDIFKMESGKIVEHWDVIQRWPTETTNLHPMF